MEYPVLHKLFNPPYAYLIFGAAFVAMAMYSTSSGKTWARFHGWVYRANEPKWFWWMVAEDYLAGFGFIAYFMYLGTTAGYPPLW
jgi:hypothetical protein